MPAATAETPTAPAVPRQVGAARWVVPILVTVIVATCYIVYSAWQWQPYTVRSWDLAIFTQALADYAAGQPPIVDIKGHEFNLLGDHFHPLLIVLAPIYALFPHAFTLLVIQAVLFALAAGIIAAAAAPRIGAGWATGIGLAMGLSFGLQYAQEAQFHEIALAVPLLAATMKMLLDRNWVWAVVWASLLVFVKEDLGLTVVAIGLLIAWLSRKTLGLWLAVWGVAFMVIALFVVLPLLNPEGRFAYGGTANPLEVLGDLEKLFHPSKFVTVGMLLLISAGLALFSPLALLMLPTLAWRFFSTNEGYFGHTWHYSAVLMPIVFGALLDAVVRLRSSGSPVLRGYSRVGPPLAVLVATVLLPTLPLWSVLAPWTPSTRAAEAEEAMAAIPEAAVVESDLGLMSYLVDDHRLYWIGNDNPTPDCLVIDMIAGNTPAEWGGAMSTAAVLHPGDAFELVYSGGGYEVACTAEVAG